MRPTQLIAAAQAAGLPENWVATLALDFEPEKAHALLSEAREMHGIARLVAKRFPEHDLPAIALEYLKNGLGRSQLCADIVSRLAEADEHIDTAPRASSMARDAWARRQADLNSQLP